MKLEATISPSQADMQVIRDGLSAFNVAKVSSLLQLSDDEVLVLVRDDSGQIMGGAIGEFDWGYLFIDTVWVKDSARGLGHATRIMQAIEGYAARQGIQRAYLATTTFQAKPLYEKLGYQVFGEIPEHPLANTMYYLWKDNLAPTATELEIQSPPNPADFNFLNQALIDDIALHVPLNMSRYAVFLRDAVGLLHGGLWGYFYWDWFDLRFLWMSDAVRSQGFGKEAMQMLFEECKQRGTIGIKTDTADFQSLSFYQSLGFEVYGTLNNRPLGHSSYFIKKLL
ncbi:MAG: GNAT family N-acetyltransferase [Anaerolineae bacterium]|nr:GNAT family N-acetyltransferase [Anaerolineae bacterium]